MHVRLRIFGKRDCIVVVDSKLTKIDEFRRIIKDKFHIDQKLQRLFYGGKLLENGYTFYDYNIKLNDVIQLMVRAKADDAKDDNTNKISNDADKPENDSKIVLKDAESEYYVEGDYVDVRDREQGCWLEGKVVRVVYDPDSNTQNHDSQNNGAIKPNIENSNDGLLYEIQMGDEKDDSNLYCKLDELRPRARNVVDIKDLKPGTKYLVNYNTENPSVKGNWYDFKLDTVQKLRSSHQLIGTVYLGPEAIPQNETKVKVHDKIFAIEKVVLVSERSKEYSKLIAIEPDKRSLPLNCWTCRDDEDTPCKDCGCFLCLGKENPEKIVLCDECNNGYHMKCLVPPLDELPEDDWYCPQCKRDPNDVVAPGAAKQTKKQTTSKSKRDWGRGMACAGKTKTCAMPPNHFGPIPGIEVGMCWRFRIQLSETGVHRPPVSGIHGRDVDGAYSIVLSGGYEDDVDYGNEFTYTGSGGRDLSGNKRTAEQSCDQQLTRENKALARNCAVSQVNEEGDDAGENWRNGKPVRVVRSYKMLKHFPKYAPKEGIRYDGIYKVVKYYPETGLSGFKVWKYLLRRDDPNPAPWEPNAKQYTIVFPDGYLEAEAEKKVQKEKRKTTKRSKNRVLRDSNNSTTESDGSPPVKKRKSPTKEQVTSAENDVIKVKIPSIFLKNHKANAKENRLKSSLTEKEREIINADTLNSKLWNECIIVCDTRGKKEFVEYTVQLFLCIICQELAASPVTTPCLHNFCHACLKLAFKSLDTPSCPCCRQDLSKFEMKPNNELKTALQTIMPGYDIRK